MDITITKATIKDVEVIALLGRITFDDSIGILIPNKKKLFKYYDKNFSIKKITKSISNPNNIFLIARIDDFPVGFMKFKINSKLELYKDSHTSEINRIFILNEFKNKGIANEIHKKLFEILKDLTTEYIWVPVLDEHLESKLFYEKQGFNPIMNHYYSISNYDLKFMVYVKKI